MLDDLGLASYNGVPHYLKRTAPSACAIDVRDPRFLDVVSTHDDLWWGVAVPQEDRTRLAAAFAGRATVERFTLLVLIRTGATTPGAASANAKSTLQTIIAALTPQLGDRDASLGAREGLVNLYALSGRPAASAAALISDVETYWGDTDVQQWDHARRWLKRGDYRRARTLAIRLVALYPGDPDAYELLAEIEDRAGGTTAPFYRALASALRA